MANDLLLKLAFIKTFSKSPTIPSSMYAIKRNTWKCYLTHQQQKQHHMTLRSTAAGSTENIQSKPCNYYSLQRFPALYLAPSMEYRQCFVLIISREMFTTVITIHAISFLPSFRIPISLTTIEPPTTFVPTLQMSFTCHGSGAKMDVIVVTKHCFFHSTLRRHLLRQLLSPYLTQ